MYAEWTARHSPPPPAPPPPTAFFECRLLLARSTCSGRRRWGCRARTGGSSRGSMVGDRQLQQTQEEHEEEHA